MSHYGYHSKAIRTNSILTEDSLKRPITVDGSLSDRNISKKLNIGASGKVVASVSELEPYTPLEPGVSTAIVIL